MMNNTLEELKNAIRQKQIILFVGSGLSCSVGLPSWNKLIGDLANQLGIDSTLFQLLGDNLSLAEYFAIKSKEINGPTYSPMELLCERIKNAENDHLNDIKNSIIHKSIVNLKCPIIYTTNYDHCLEIAYEQENMKYHTISNVRDIITLPSDTTQIVKIHGDYTCPQDIVFTESSYFDRLDFESPLDIKLRGDMLSKSILFIGYSLSDVNIRLLIHKLDKIWKKNSGDTNEFLATRPKSYIFMARPNYIQEAILQQRDIVPIIGNNLDQGISTQEFLENIQP